MKTSPPNTWAYGGVLVRFTWLLAPQVMPALYGHPRTVNTGDEVLILRTAYCGTVVEVFPSPTKVAA